MHQDGAFWGVFALFWVGGVQSGALAKVGIFVPIVSFVAIETQRPFTVALFIHRASESKWLVDFGAKYAYQLA